MWILKLILSYGNIEESEALNHLESDDDGEKNGTFKNRCSLDQRNSTGFNLHIIHVKTSFHVVLWTLPEVILSTEWEVGPKYS